MYFLYKTIKYLPPVKNPNVIKSAKRICNLIRIHGLLDYIKSENANGETREQKIRVSLPTRQGFANFIGVSFSNLTEWYAIPEMAIALQKIDAVQFTRLVNNGLSGSYNPSITKMLLSSNHGMSDNTKVEGEVGVVHKVMRLPTKSELDAPEN